MERSAEPPQIEAAAGSHRLIVLGETHGTRETPRLAAALVQHYAAREPVLLKSVQLRNPYIDPLNYLQVEMIRRLRTGEQKMTAEETEETRRVIELTINGISGGLKNTG